jgi:hypothetical protein
MTPSLKPQPANHSTPDIESLKTIWQAIRQQLESRKTSLYDELKHYPTPIARCDEHFTHLMEKRARVFQTVSRMEALSHDDLTASDYVALIEEFIASPVDTGDPTEQAIRLRSKAQLAELYH